MRTLFAKFLLSFWLGLAVLLAAEIVLETHSLEQGLAVHSERVDGPFALYADLARATLAERGVTGLDSLRARLERDASIQAFRIDSLGAGVASRDTPDDARKAGLAALKAGHSMLVETPEGFFLGYPLGRIEGRHAALVLHPLAGSHGAQREHERAWPPFLPHDLGERALATLVLGGLGCYLLARYVTAPVTRLRQATRRLADGDLTARVGSEQRRRRDELEDLGRDFDRMAERLQALLGAQRRLLSDISHELRSPLARMNVALGLMRQGGAADVESNIARLELEASRLNEMIGDVLALSRAESGEPVPASQAVDLVALATEVADDARFEAGPRVTITIARSGPVVAMGAPELLRSALENVIRNAVRYSPAGAAVEVMAERHEEAGRAEAMITVRDHGPGVPGTELEKIFEPFYRVNAGEAERAGPRADGTGLGLAIARRVLARHGGSIAASAAPGGGLAITIRLPAV